MERSRTFGLVLSYGAGLTLLAIGIGNLVYVHPVPGIAFLIFSTIYYPPVTNWLGNKIGVRTASVFKFIVWFVLVWFTLGISDLGELMGF